MELTAEQKEALEQQKAQCVFCQIIAGKIPSKKIYEDDKVIAIMDIRPSAKGHLLLMPKEHFFIMPIIPPDIFKHMVVKARDISKSMKKALLSDFTTIFVANGGLAGQQVPHFMMHIVPREKNDGLGNFEVPKKEITADERKEIEEKIKPHLVTSFEKNLTALGLKKPNPNAPAPKDIGKVGKEQVIQIINQNPQLKEAIIKDPEGFKQIVPNHPQLKQIFKDVDIDEIIEKIIGKKTEKIIDAEFTEKADVTEPKETNPQEETKKEKVTESKDLPKPKKNDAETDLDLISRLF